MSGLLSCASGRVRFDAGAPPILEPIEVEEGREATFIIPAAEFDLHRMKLEPDTTYLLSSAGPETLLVLSDTPDVVVTFRSDDNRVEARRG